MDVRIWIAPLLLVALAGCVADDDDGPERLSEAGDGYSSAWTPDMLPDPVTGLKMLANPESNSTTGVWVEDGLAYLSGGSGLRIYDVSDPRNATLISTPVEDDTGSRDVDIMKHTNGRTYAVLAHSGSGISFVDVTDPTTPTLVTRVTEIGGSAHNIAVVPNSTIVYNSRSISQHIPTPGNTGEIDIVDFADPENPAITVWRFPAVALGAAGAPKPVLATTCHDITFTPINDRAYCAGITETHVWDISDPLQPVIAQVILNPLNNIHHGAWATPDGNLLLIGDEFAGAAGGTTCVDPIPNPYGALWFWDISNLAVPVPVGYYQITYNSVTEVDPSLCTTHFGTFVDDRDLFVLGWYTAGVGIVDFSDPANAFQVAHYRPEGAMNVWDARYFEGHLYTGDTARGMEILRLT